MPDGAEAPMSLDVSSPIEHADYFTLEEYRSIVKEDESVGSRLQEEDVMRFQAEVVERLEAWARTAWRRRTRVERAFTRNTQMRLGRVPVISVESLSFAETALSEYIFASGGALKWGVIDDEWETTPIPAEVVVNYTYGYDTVPWAVKRPCIEATRALAWMTDPEGNIPPNTESYTSGGTTIRFATVDADDVTQPWPFHERASADIRAYWGPRRPRRYMVGA